MLEFEPIRLNKKYKMTVPGTNKQVFPLLCPVREYDWLPYWNCDIIYSESGIAEQGCVFTTDLPGRGKMIWIVTKYDPPTQIQYTIFKHDSHVWNLNVTIETISEFKSNLVWCHEFTALTKSGNEYLTSYTEEAHQSHLKRIEDSLIHYLGTGNMLKE
ncbi:MAG: hypothetical protein PVI89_01460 [Desulfobacteraceae bacterium]|jgi:hypothetical protein